MSRRDEPPLVVPIKAVETARLQDKHYREGTFYRLFLGYDPRPFPHRPVQAPPGKRDSLLILLTVLPLWIAALAWYQWPAWRAVPWRPPPPDTWEVVEGQISDRWWPDSYALMLPNGRYVDLSCAPDLAGTWSCGRAYNQLMRSLKGEPITLALVDDRRPGDSCYVVVWARDAEGRVSRYGEFRPRLIGTVMRTIIHPIGLPGFIFLPFGIYGLWHVATRKD